MLAVTISDSMERASTSQIILVWTIRDPPITQHQTRNAVYVEGFYGRSLHGALTGWSGTVTCRLPEYSHAAMCFTQTAWTRRLPRDRLTNLHARYVQKQLPVKDPHRSQNLFLILKGLFSRFTDPTPFPKAMGAAPARIRMQLISVNSSRSQCSAVAVP